ncbi:sigma-70 family RNA polymerase sigma factor [Ketogulonicigenium vulgare]|uniref:sigma-70 family RNA polymerase sigma factor n=1 Tax=Ketogulonicigenium vulgare TaxID=92945 RepID=UPI0023597996|nr:sigma-70 family RNA polymerase sigma factor [Ketogulonicigenium vulgare]
MSKYIYGSSSDQSESPRSDEQHRTTTDEVVAVIPNLRKLAYTLCRNTGDADDLVQDTLLRAISKVHQFESGTNLRAWLYTIMRNAFYTEYRKRAREAPAELDCASSLPIDVRDFCYWRLRAKEVESALNFIPKCYSQALILVTVEGASYDQACQTIGCNMGTLKSRVNRGRAALKAHLNEENSVMTH